MRKNNANDGDKKIVCIYHRAAHVFFVIHSFTHLSTLLSIYPFTFLPSIHPFIYQPSIHPSTCVAHSSPLFHKPFTIHATELFTLQVQHFL